MYRSQLATENPQSFGAQSSKLLFGQHPADPLQRDEVAVSKELLPKSEFIFHQTEDGRTRIQCRFENETVWLTQKLMAELFGKDVRTINEHVQNICEEGELVAESVIRKFRTTAADGK